MSPQKKIPQPKIKIPAERGSSPDFSVPLEDKIRYRAYELYQQRGGEEGHAIDDWLLAEKEINRQQSNRRAA